MSDDKKGVALSEQEAFEQWVRPRNFTSVSEDAARLGWMARATSSQGLALSEAEQEALREAIELMTIHGGNGWSRTTNALNHILSRALSSRAEVPAGYRLQPISEFDALQTVLDAVSSRAEVEKMPRILKGVGKINGDGWKDVTRIGEIVYVWDLELPKPYMAGQYPRIGNPIWSASTRQYDFSTIPESEYREVIDSIIEKVRSELNEIRYERDGLKIAAAEAPNGGKS